MIESKCALEVMAITAVHVLPSIFVVLADVPKEFTIIILLLFEHNCCVFTDCCYWGKEEREKRT